MLKNNYVFPVLETQGAIKDHIESPEDIKKFLHLAQLVYELNTNIRKHLVEVLSTKEYISYLNDQMKKELGEEAE